MEEPDVDCKCPECGHEFTTPAEQADFLIVCPECDNDEGSFAPPQ